MEKKRKSDKAVWRAERLICAALTVHTVCSITWLHHMHTSYKPSRNRGNLTPGMPGNNLSLLVFNLLLNM